MGFWSNLFAGSEVKATAPVERRSEAYIDSRIQAEDATGLVSVVCACATVISEGLALPPIYVQRSTTSGRVFDDKHPLHRVITAKPNLTQTAYELRETMGWNAAIHGNAYAWLNRARDGEIIEIVPLKPSEIQRVDPVRLGALPTYLVNGRDMSPANIWHFKGPVADRHSGRATSIDAQRAINLTIAAESLPKKKPSASPR